MKPPRLSAGPVLLDLLEDAEPMLLARLPRLSRHPRRHRLEARWRPGVGRRRSWWSRRHRGRKPPLVDLIVEHHAILTFVIALLLALAAAPCWAKGGRSLGWPQIRFAVPWAPGRAPVPRAFGCRSLGRGACRRRRGRCLLLARPLARPATASSRAHLGLQRLQLELTRLESPHHLVLFQ